ncbi:MAG: Co2+/Mg2+ efflux protein ApaG [Hyphomicrobiaceae bacterium]
MYQAITHNIRVTVVPQYLPERSEPAASRYFWAYTIEIANQGHWPMQLRSRYWRITDALGRTEEVRGPGVVGEEPVIMPGSAFTYTSGCPLSTSSGIMVGTYQMQLEDGRMLDIAIPAFSLDCPDRRPQLN